MVFDNRFLPLLPPYHSRIPEKPSAFTSDLFVMFGHEAYKDSENSVGIPEIFGIYDQNKLANALVLLGNPNPLLPDFAGLIGKQILWDMHGKIETQGISFSYNQQFTKHFSFGMDWFFMHLFSRIDFSMPKQTQNSLGLSDAEVIHLDSIRRHMQQEAGFKAPTYEAAGISDIEMYIRCGKIWDYYRKFKRIDAGARVGVIFPSGVTRNITNPASIPFGGDGLWGVYIMGDLEIEVREDWKAGGFFRMNQRFSRKQSKRMPIAGEQQLFGAVQGPVFLEPGPTFIVSPYARLEDLRDGLGLHIQYTYVSHLDDTWEDKRPVPVPPAQLQPVFKYSDWASEYVTLTIFYDFARVRQEHLFAPMISFCWDMPVAFFGAYGVSKTQRISLGLVFSY
jgi:hypothetical protein